MTNRNTEEDKMMGYKTYTERETEGKKVIHMFLIFAFLYLTSFRYNLQALENKTKQKQKTKNKTGAKYIDINFWSHWKYDQKHFR